MQVRECSKDIDAKIELTALNADNNTTFRRNQFGNLSDEPLIMSSRYELLTNYA